MIVYACVKCGRKAPTSTCARCKKEQQSSGTQGYYRTQAWRDLKAQASSYYRNLCEVCGSTEHITFHHLMPREMGGPDSIANLAPLCRRCHSKYERAASQDSTAQIVKDVEAIAKSRGIELQHTQARNAPAHFTQAQTRNLRRRRSRRR